MGFAIVLSSMGESTRHSRHRFPAAESRHRRIGSAEAARSWDPTGSKSTTSQSVQPAQVGPPGRAASTAIQLPPVQQTHRFTRSAAWRVLWSELVLAAAGNWRAPPEVPPSSGRLRPASIQRSWLVSRLATALPISDRRPRAFRTFHSCITNPSTANLDLPRR